MLWQSQETRDVMGEERDADKLCLHSRVGNRYSRVPSPGGLTAVDFAGYPGSSS